MDTDKFEYYKERLLAGWQNLIKKSDEDAMAGFGREKIVVFAVSFILAFCLWLMVNLSRDFNLNINLPIAVANIPEDQALTEPLPETATVSISGEGWKLINVYNNPPEISVNVTDREINLYDQVRQNMNMLPDLSVQKVQPLIVSANLEQKVSKKVPVVSNVQLSFRSQYGLIDSVSLEPDSVTVSGAASLINDIEQWETDSLVISDIAGSITQSIPLKEPGELVSLNRSEVQITAPVAQFTEAEVRVNLSTRNMPLGNDVRFSPSSIIVRFDVPIENYASIADTNPFEAYVTYEQLMEDSSGFVEPTIEQRSETDYPIKIRSYQPRRVAYFMVLDS